MKEWSVLVEDKRDGHVFPIWCWGKDENHAIEELLKEFPTTVLYYEIVGVTKVVTLWDYIKKLFKRY